MGTLSSLQRGPRSGFLLDRVFPIEGISLRGPIRGTGTGGKLNLLLFTTSFIKNLKLYKNTLIVHWKRGGSGLVSR